ncbi:hypothetical protein BASA81_002798 [Batrachochytrium salamandrivorans]|nr:hypothetical protein BASA81_002798 [Batrachochytrium salamandrivorans]
MLLLLPLLLVGLVNGQVIQLTKEVEEMTGEELVNNLIADVLHAGATFTFPALKGLGITVTPGERIGPEVSPNYKTDKWGTGNGDELDFDNLIILNEESFEHLTQAGSGMTTGHWFVLFGTTWCAHCEHMMPHWNKTARELKGEINVAWIDAGAAFFTSKRFNITKYPSAILLKRGQRWDYDMVNQPRTWKEFITFARTRGEPGDEVVGSTIPPPLDSFEQYYQDAVTYFTKIYEFAQSKPLIALVLFCLGGLVAAVPLAYVLLAPIDPSFPSIQRGEHYQGAATWDGSTDAPIAEEEEQTPVTTEVVEAPPQPGLTQPQKRKTKKKM